MITSGDIFYKKTDGGTLVMQRQTLFGLSTDSKPTNVCNGSVFIEMDSNDVYFFDAENAIWRVFVGGAE